MIVDTDVLEPQFVPQDLHHRDGQLDALATALEPLMAGGYGEDILSVGPTGAGKTTLAKYIVRQLPADATIRVGYVNCARTQTPTATLGALVQNLGLDVCPPEGKSRAHYLDQLGAVDGQMLCILDEVHVLSEAAVIHALYDMPSVTLVAIALDADQLLQDCPPQIASRVRTFEQVTCPRYGHQELVDILESRVRHGLVSSRVEVVALDVIADRAAGDARLAIRFLDQAARHVVDHDVQMLTPAVVQATADALDPTVPDQSLTSLDTHQRTLYEILREAGGNGLAASEVHERYEERVADPRTRSTRRKLLANLVQIGLIEKTGRGRGTRYAVAAPKIS